MRSESSNEKSNNKDEPESEEDKSLFALEICTELLPYYEELRPFIICYCIATGQNENTSKSLLSTIGVETPSIHNIKEALGNQKSAFFAECFEWATSCGEIKYAINACKIAIHTIWDPKPDMINHLLRSLRIIVTSLHEKNATSKDNKEKKQFAKLLQGDDDINLKLYYEYISLLLHLLGSLCKATKTVRHDILNAICNFSSCGDTEFKPIFERFVKLALILVEIPHSINNANVDGGVLINIATNNLLLSKLDNKKASRLVNRLFKLVALLFDNELYNLIVPHTTTFYDQVNGISDNSEIVISQEMKVSISLLMLIPYFAVNCPETLFKSIAQKTIPILQIDISPIWCALRQKESKCHSEMEGIISNLASISGYRLVSAVIKNLSMIMNRSTCYSSAVYTMSYYILKNSPSPKELSMQRIVIHALREKSESSDLSLMLFLPLYQKLIGNFEKLPSIKISTIFPVHDICPNLPKWGPGEFPLSPIEYSFFYFNVIAEVRNECLQIQVSPYTVWSEEIFNAESLPKPSIFQTLSAPKIGGSEITRFLSTIHNNIKAPKPEQQKVNGSPVSHESPDNESYSQEYLFMVPGSVFEPKIEFIDSLAHIKTSEVYESRL